MPEMGDGKRDGLSPDIQAADATPTQLVTEALAEDSATPAKGAAAAMDRTAAGAIDAVGTAGASPLSYSAGLQRRFGGWRDLPGWWRLYWVGLLAGLGMALALSASIVWLPAIAILIVGVSQGAVIGECLRHRNRKDLVRVGGVVFVVSVTCGLVSVLAVHLLFYFKAAYEVSQAVTTAPFFDHIVDLLTNRSGVNGFRVLSMVTSDIVGREGFLGYMLHRSHSNRRWAGIVLVHAVVTVVASWLVARMALRAPACPDCGEWLGDDRNVAVVPGWLTGELMDAVVTGSPAKAFEVGRLAAGRDLGNDCAIARTKSCPSCDKVFAYVFRSTAIVGDRQVTNTTATLGGLVPVTAEMVRALKTEHVLPVDEENELADKAEAPAASGGDAILTTADFAAKLDLAQTGPAPVKSAALDPSAQDATKTR